MLNSCARSLMFCAFVFSQTAHAKDPWEVTLGAVMSGGCLQNFYYEASEIQLRLDLADPLAPTLALESLFLSDSESVIDGERIYFGSQWIRRAAMFKGKVTAIDLDQKTWSFVLQSELFWTFEYEPSFGDLPFPPLNTTNNANDPDPVFVLTCVPEKLSLKDGSDIVALQCDLVSRSSLKGLWIFSFRAGDGVNYNKQRIYFRQGGSLNGFSNGVDAFWQEAPVSKLIWGE